MELLHWPDGLGALRHGVLSQLPGQLLMCSWLLLPKKDGEMFLVVHQMTCFSSGPFSNVIAKGVPDVCGLDKDTNIGIDLFQHLVLVKAVILLLFLLLVLPLFCFCYSYCSWGLLVGSVGLAQWAWVFQQHLFSPVSNLKQKWRQCSCKWHESSGGWAL